MDLFHLRLGDTGWVVSRSENPVQILPSRTSSQYEVAIPGRDDETCPFTFSAPLHPSREGRVFNPPSLIPLFHLDDHHDD